MGRPQEPTFINPGAPASPHCRPELEQGQICHRATTRSSSKGGFAAATPPGARATAGFDVAAPRSSSNGGIWRRCPPELEQRRDMAPQTQAGPRFWLGIRGVEHAAQSPSKRREYAAARSSDSRAPAS
ncbi:unnamed protein product [Urochloa humidicola]